MSTVALLGTGLLGSGMAERLLGLGHEVRVWNRTPSKTAPLAALGASVAADPAACVAGAERVHLVLSEDSAVDAVVDAFSPALGRGVPVVDHSTNLPASVAERTSRLRGAGVAYTHAPVFMGPGNARAGTGLMLLSEGEDRVEALRPLLEPMTGRLLLVGVEPGRAATFKLLGNGMLFVLTAGMGDLFRIGAANGVSPEEVLTLFDAFAPTPAAMGRRALTAGGGPVGFELSMARKDARLMVEAAGGGLTVLPAIASSMDAAIQEGRGSGDFAVIFKP